ncbi:phage tail protein [Variovorax soli]|uniref:Microcystin-dependent protein n=1 Tax=Variovorax soli TaxID=376815 RepID=A0ABU1NLV6_9BURK|nr:phage tail protein [Variovorax soli]MDR6538861.1 microcystin-dependent protein [Variovorax soli]
MAIVTTLAACNTNQALNGPAGTDLPSTLDDAIRYALSFIAQLRDGAAIPTGVALPWLTSAAAPLGWIKLNGALVSRTTYANLFAFATAAGLVSEATWSGGQFGSFSVGDGSTTFRVPDWRAMFIRGLDESRGLDTGRVLGVWQDQANVLHGHGYTDPTHTHAVSDPGHAHGASADVQGAHTHSYNASQNTLSLGPGAATAALVTGPFGTSADGAHNHNITVGGAFTSVSLFAASVGITISNQGSADGHPRNLAYPHIIKY